MLGVCCSRRIPKLVPGVLRFLNVEKLVVADMFVAAQLPLWTHEQLKNIWWNMIWLSLHEFSSPTLSPCHFFMWGPVLCKNTVVYFALMSHDITWPYFMSYNVIHVWFEIHSESHASHHFDDSTKQIPFIVVHIFCHQIFHAITRCHGLPWLAIPRH